MEEVRVIRPADNSTLKHEVYASAWDALVQLAQESRVYVEKVKQ